MNEFDPSVPGSAAEREWQLQERARRAQREGRPAADGPPEERAYRLIATALATPPPDGLPADFARQVARRVRREAAARDGLEPVLLGVLATLGLIAGAVVLVGGDPSWLGAFTAPGAARVLANPLVLALAACVGASALLARPLRAAARRAA